MKPIVLFFTILFFSVASVFSQNWFVGGSVRINISSVDELDINALNYHADYYQVKISPIIGYKFDGFDIGISPIFQYKIWEQNVEYNPYQNSKDTGFGAGIGLFSRYTIFTFRDFSILGRLDAEYLYSADKMINNTQTIEEKTHQVSLNLSPVFEYTLLDRLSVFTDFGIDGISCSFRNNTISTTDFYSSPTRNINTFQFSLPSLFRMNITSFTIGLYINI